jgi:hypothetical protein
MVYFQTKNPTLGKIWRVFEWKMLLFMTIWNIFRSFGIIYGPLVQLAVIWHIFPDLVCLDPEKSGNPASQRKRSENLIYDILRLKSTATECDVPRPHCHQGDQIRRIFVSLAI